LVPNNIYIYIARFLTFSTFLSSDV
jgi:hypothetical protein